MLKAVNAEQNEIYTAIKAFRVFENPHGEKYAGSGSLLCPIEEWSKNLVICES